MNVRIAARAKDGRKNIFDVSEVDSVEDAMHFAKHNAYEEEAACVIALVPKLKQTMKAVA